MIEFFRIPREDEPPVVSNDFPSLRNLHLDMIEDKFKIKPGLPAIREEKPCTHGPYAHGYDDGPVQTDDESEDESEDGSQHPNDDESDDVSYAESDDDVLRELGEDVSEAASVEEVEEEEEEDDGLTPEERLDQEKDDMLVRFRMLHIRNRNGKLNLDIPEYSEHSDLPTMKRTYRRITREIAVHSNLHKLKIFIQASWAATEYMMCEYVGVDMRGFAARQQEEFDLYEGILIEMGERDYMKWGSNASVEVRLLGLILVQAAAFWVFKHADTNPMMASIISQMAPQREKSTTPQEPPAKRRGPSDDTE